MFAEITYPKPESVDSSAGPGVDYTYDDLGNLLTARPGGADGLDMPGNLNGDTEAGFLQETRLPSFVNYYHAGRLSPNFSASWELSGSTRIEPSGKRMVGTLRLPLLTFFT